MPHLRRLLFLGAVVLTLSIPAIVSAQTLADAQRQNIRCLIVTSILAGNDNPTVKQIGMMGGLYYAGKIFGADPQIDLSAALKQEVQAIEPGEVDAITRSCGLEMQKRGKEIKDAGEAVKGIKLPEKKPPTT